MLSKLKTIFFVFSFLFLLVLVSPKAAFANGIRNVTFDGTNYTIQGATNQPDSANAECALDNYGVSVLVDKDCSVSGGVFTFTWPATTFAPNPIQPQGYNFVVWVCSPNTSGIYDTSHCSGSGEFIDNNNGGQNLFYAIPNGITNVAYDNSTFSLQGATNLPDGTGKCVLEDFGNVYVVSACPITNGVVDFSWPASGYTPEANHQPAHGYLVWICGNNDNPQFDQCSTGSYFLDTSDPHLFDSVLANYPPVVGTLTIIPNPVQTNSPVTATTSFTDQNATDTHTAIIDWGNGTSSCNVSESNGSGSVTCNLPTGYTTANVYSVTITVSDGTNQVNTPTAYVSVYDPTQGSIFSAGQRFSSPVGAYTANSSLTGNVIFGLSYKYSGTMPVGVRQFSMDFNNANLHFNATNVSSLVISNGIATLQGTGTLNGQSGYNYLVTGSNGGGIRIQFTDSSNNIIYDTQPNAPITATPTTSVTGHIVVN